MMDELAGIPGWLKWVSMGGAGIAAGALFLWQYLSNAKVDRSVDGATVELIKNLQTQLVNEQGRADSLMREREAMATEIGQLRGEVHGLREQVRLLTEAVDRMRGVVK